MKYKHEDVQEQADISIMRSAFMGKSIAAMAEERFMKKEDIESQILQILANRCNMKSPKQIIHKIQELKFARDKIFGTLDGDKIGIFIRALEWVLQEDNQWEMIQ